MGRRFYFDLTNGEDLIRDDDGVDASGLDEAIKEAQAALDEMRGSHSADMPGAGWKLIIRDEDGAIQKTLPLDADGFH